MEDTVASGLKGFERIPKERDSVGKPIVIFPLTCHVDTFLDHGKLVSIETAFTLNVTISGIHHPRVLSLIREQLQTLPFDNQMSFWAAL